MDTTGGSPQETLQSAQEVLAETKTKNKKKQKFSQRNKTTTAGRMFRLELDSSEEEHERLLDSTDYHRKQQKLQKLQSTQHTSLLTATDSIFTTTDSKFEQIDDHTATHTASAVLSKGNEPQFICHYCDTKFFVRGYLTRHIKKHAIEKAYKCPFYRKASGKSNVSVATLRKLNNNCHPTGGFSRRDTYKTHLKTRHIVYPAGIKPVERNKFGGHCTQCGEFTKDLNNWVEEHIENGQCSGLPQDYVMSVQDKRSNQNKRYGKNGLNGRLQMIKVSNGESRFVSSVESEMEPNVLLNNKNAVEAMAIMAHRANQNNLLSKYGDNKIIMQGFSEQEELNQPQEIRELSKTNEINEPKETNAQIKHEFSIDSFLPTNNTKDINSTTVCPSTNTQKRNSVDKLLDDLSILQFDFFQNEFPNVDYDNNLNNNQSIEDSLQFFNNNF